MGDVQPRHSHLLSLPTELVLNILGYLDSFDLINVARTCKALFPHGYDDLLWQPLIARQLGSDVVGPAHFNSFRELYAAHHPYWFLPRNRIWFSDKAHSGKLLISRYEPQTGFIMAYPATAVRGRANLQFWDQDGEVVIHSFNPNISLDLESPVVRLPIHRKLDTEVEGQETTKAPFSYAKEISMDIPPEPGPNNAFMLCRTLPEAAIGANTHVWPPLRFPAYSRTRNASSDEFTSLGHRPTTLEEVSQCNFRIRKWMDFHGREVSLGSMPSDLSPNFAASLRRELWARFNATISRGISVRMPQEITTFATIPEHCYTPTPTKPWQGVWCGDYSGHGCEFLLITQPDEEEQSPLPEGLRRMQELMSARVERRTGPHLMHALDTIDILRAYQGAEQASSASDGRPNGVDNANQAGPSLASSPSQQVDIPGADGGIVPTGRLEAIKLTGDLNIPRGEYTFIAPDVGPAGLLRVAHEPVFRGARVVRSAGHIAGQNFTHDQYTPSQLIMISHDQLAHYWERMGHISYYQRVDLDALVSYGLAEEDSSHAAGERPS